MRAIALVALLLLAGCAGAPAATNSSSASSGTVVGEGGPPVVQGLNWSVGQTWTHAIRIGNGTDAIAFENQVVVTDATDIGWKLASSDPDTAIRNAAFFFQDMGEMLRRGDLADNGYAFPYYAFPLEDNKTWTATESNIDTSLETVERSLTMTARWQPAKGGEPARFLIEARTEAGTLRARYDYRPDLQWFGSFEGFDGASAYRMETTKSGKNWKGEHHHAASELRFGTIIQGELDPSNPTPLYQPAGGVFVGASVEAEATHVFLLQFAYGAPGAGATQLIAPDGTRYSTAGAYGADPTPLYSDDAQQQVIAPAQAGNWEIQAASGGAFANGYGVFLWQMTLATGSL